MPPTGKHLSASLERTGKDYKDVHEWIDGDPEKKAERHDITKIYEHGKLIEERYGKEGLQEFIQHIHDDVKSKFEHVQDDLEKSIAATLASLGIR